MPRSQRLLSIGQRRGERLIRELADALREARIGLGLSLSRLSELAGVSRSKLWRLENARVERLDLVGAARLCQVLGLDLSLKTFPTGAPIRDAGHVRVMDRLAGETPNVHWSREYTVPIAGDLRAWDMFARVENVSIGVTAETKFRDEQGLLRRERAKLRDSGVDRWILLLSDTRANRSVLNEIRESLREEFPLGGRGVLNALRAGRDPGANGIVLL
jgi:transcriptional regulator with XRE-family HTH domain